MLMACPLDTSCRICTWWRADAPSIQSGWDLTGDPPEAVASFDRLQRHGITRSTPRADHDTFEVHHPRLLHAQVKKLVNAAYERARNILTNNRDELDALASELLDKESLTGSQVCVDDPGVTSVLAEISAEQ